MPEPPASLSDLRIDRSRFDREPGGSRRWLLLGAAALAAALVAFFFLRPRPAPVTVAEVVEGEASDRPAAVLHASGYVTARRQATVSSKVTGRVTEVLVEEGMRVEEGQVLARLEASQTLVQRDLARAELAAAERALAETEVRIAEAELARGRARALLAEEIGSQAELDAADAAADSLRARLAAQRGEVEVRRRGVAVVEQALDDLVIRAPFAGVALSKNAQPGEIISPMSAGGGFTRTGISTIVDMASLEIEVDVNEAYIGRVEPGQAVTATLDAYPDLPLAAHVITTIPAADRQRATVKVRIGFDALDPRILPDMGVKVAFLAAPPEAGDGPRRVAKVPRAALRGAAGAEHVLVVVDGKAERRAVRVGAAAGDPAEVESGLAAGEQVVVEGPEGLAGGERVRVRPAGR
jgi:RND family efflux transporter MFP subunit